MKLPLDLFVNGRPFELLVDPQRTLAQVLREDLGLTGTKEACGLGSCGSCTVLLEGTPVLSCLLLAVTCRGKHVVTVEGLADQGVLSRVQEAFVDYGAIQCGMCSPGMILCAEALLRENPRPSEDDVRHALSGNLCRCTGYQKIVEAVLAAGEVEHV